MTTAYGIVGASSFVGSCVVQQLDDEGMSWIGFSRSLPTRTRPWRHLAQAKAGETIDTWIVMASIWTFKDRCETILSYGPKKIVAVSSTSRFTKSNSSSSKEIEVAAQIECGEQDFAEWCEQRGIAWVIIRPTMIYGTGRDQNVRSIAEIIRRLGFFPMFRNGAGLRQPIHAEDLASACIAAAKSAVTNRAFNVSGGEVITYRQMVSRVFEVLGRRPLIVPVPLSLFALGAALINRVPRFAHVTMQMAERMSADMVFDHTEASEAFGFAPRPFQLSKSDLV